MANYMLVDAWYNPVTAIALHSQPTIASNVLINVLKPYFFVGSVLPANRGIMTHRFFSPGNIPAVARAWLSINQGSVIVDKATVGHPVPRIYIVQTSQEVYNADGSLSGIYLYCWDNNAVSSAGRYSY